MFKLKTTLKNLNLNKFNVIKRYIHDNYPEKEFTSNPINSSATRDKKPPNKADKRRLDNYIREDTLSFSQKIKNESDLTPKFIDEEEFISDRNFKSLIDEASQSTKYLNTFSNVILDDLCQVFFNNYLNNNQEILKKEFLKIIQKDPRYAKKDEEFLGKEAKRIISSFSVIYEFIDRGMKGLLTGDITPHFIRGAVQIINKFSSELGKIEEEFKAFGLNPHDFYESFFKIDNKFFVNNSSKNIAMNLSKHFENEGALSKRLLYYVNLKHTQFFDLFKTKLILKENKDIKVDEVKKIITKKKNNVQNIFNELYNSISDLILVNKLKTPQNGIKFPDLENKHNLFRRQLIIEEGCFERANEDFLNIYSSLQNIDKAHEMFFNRKMLINWHQSLNFSISESQKMIINSLEFTKKNNDFLKFYISLPSNEISIICLLHLLKLIINNMTLKKEENEEEKYLKALNKIEAAEEDYEISIPLVSFAEDLGSLFLSELRNTKIEKSFENPNAKTYFKNLSANLFQYEITKKDKIKLGVFLTHILINNLKYSANEDIQNSNLKLLKISKKKIDESKYHNVVEIDKNFISKYYSDIQKTFSLNIQIKKSLPMLFEPLAWKSLKIGGYYLRQTSLTKIVPDHQEASILYEVNDISKVTSVLDRLGSVKWKINRNVLDIIDYIWANGGGKGSIPKRFNDRIITKSMIQSSGNFKEKINLLKEAQVNRESHSLRCDFLIKMQIAKDYANCHQFYYPHNLDYRGRAYPISPHLNHLGSDMSRGLLTYSEEKPLGEDGLKWLKIHLANVIGKDKLTLTGRQEYVDSIIDQVHACARDPYRNQWWLEAENPWQTIAAMIEVSNAVRSSNPKEYRTCLPVHVDGSCNGLQHYAALARDLNGGYEVNLVNRDKPGDVYTKVLDIVKVKVQNENNPIDKKYADLLIENNILTRKVIKQTVMTSVYGVTLIGARDQIKKQLKETNLFDPQSLFYISMYLAKKTIESIGDLFKEANAIKAWLTKCALIISHSNNTVKWITPLGLPCVQPYKRLTELDLIRTHAQGIMVISNFDKQPVNKKKQGSAFPPNYIHSLDSSHMMYTCTNAVENGVNFASVHDSFWAHPSDITYLNKEIRQQFVHLHSQPLLENLLSNFKSSYPELKFPDIPPRGELDLKNVLDSTYFFS